MTTSPAPDAARHAERPVVDPVIVDPTIVEQALIERALFDEEVAAHDRVERRLLWKEVACIAFVVAVVIARQLWLT
ncbi:MAG: hypothetical protein ABWZ99_18485 [Ilumatobacteraceae bacterium]